MREQSHSCACAAAVLAILLVSYLVAQAPDPHIVFSQPAPGQIFAPGDRMPVVLRVTPPLHPTDAIIYLSGLGMLEGKDADFNGSTFRWQFPIPLEYAGPLVLTPMVVAGEDPAHPGTALTFPGAPVTVSVKPKEAPLKLSLAEHNFYLEPHSAIDKQCLHVRGEFGNAERDLTSPATGTTYRSSAPAVALVDGEGCVRVIGPGLATITAENHGVRDFAIFVIEDPRNPLPPQDVTAKLKISRSAIRLDPNAKAYNTYPLSVQTITITNTSAEPVPGPLYLTVRDLPEGVELWLKAANIPANPPPDMIVFSLQNHAPGKSAPVRLEPKNGLKLNPGESVTEHLYFMYAKSEPRYSLRVVRAGDTRQIP